MGLSSLRIVGSLLLLGCCLSCQPSHEPALKVPQEKVIYTLRALPEEGVIEVQADLPQTLASGWACVPTLGSREGEGFSWLGLWQGERALSVEWTQEGCFRLPKRRGLQLRYRVSRVPGARPQWRAASLTPYADGDSFFFTGESLFVEFRDDLRLQATATELRIESSLDSASSLLSSSPYIATSNRELIASVLWLSPKLQHRSLETMSGGLELSSEQELDAAFLQELRCIADQLEAWAPGRVDGLSQVLLLDAAWDRYAATGFARSGGVVLQLGAEAMDEDLRRQRLISHELFHRYNGESLRIDERDFDALSWFLEGTTNYVSELSLVHSGLISQEQYLAQLAEHALQYQENPAHEGESKLELDWTRLPYDRGVLISLALDLILRDISDGQRSLHGFFVHLAKSSSWDKPLTLALLEDEFGQYAGVSLAAFFANYVEGEAPIPVEQLFRNGGARIIRTTRPVYSMQMQVLFDPEAAALRIFEAPQGGVAWLAGVRPGDIFVPLETTSFRRDGSFVEFEVERQGERRFVRLKPRRIDAMGMRLELQGGAAIGDILDEMPAASCVE